MTILKRAALWAAWFGLAALVVEPAMPGRNGSGTYTIPNVFVPGATVTASGHNQNFTDIANELTNSVAADGQTTMTGPLKAASGSVSAPGVAFGSDTDTGMYRIGANNLGISAGGTKIIDVASTGATVTGTLDATAVKIGGGNVWSTGDVKLTLKTSADTGWVMMNDGTIGNASSSATTRANADTETLFILLWTNCSDSYCAVSGGRGASAAADYAANKTIALSKVLGRALAIAGSGSGLTARTLGQTVGAETATIAQANLPNVTLTTNITDSRTWYIDSAQAPSSINTGGAGGAVNYFRHNPPNTYSISVSGSISASTPLGGSGTALSIVDPTTFLNAMIKL